MSVAGVLTDCRDGIVVVAVRNGHCRYHRRVHPLWYVSRFHPMDHDSEPHVACRILTRALWCYIVGADISTNYNADQPTALYGYSATPRVEYCSTPGPCHALLLLTNLSTKLLYSALQLIRVGYGRAL